MRKVLSYSIEDRDGIKVIHLSGNLSSNTRKEFHDLVGKLIESNSVIINMSDVDLITSSGIEALKSVSLEARRRNNRVFLMRVSGYFLRLLEDLDLYDHFILIESVEEGQTKMKFYL